MMNKLMVAASLFCLYMASLPCYATDKVTKMPNFKDYVVNEIYTSKPAAVDLSSSPSAKMFKTRLTEGIKKGVNFAGAYTIVSWGCGTNCSTSAILETKTGKVLAWFVSCGAEQYEKDSKLLIINPTGNGRISYPDGCKTEYYIWDGSKLTKI
jgi:hypothetical protein